MKPRIGVIGPRAVVEQVLSLARSEPGVDLVAVPCPAASDVACAVKQVSSSVDCWLCTDPIVHGAVERESSFASTCLEYGGVSLLSAVTKLAASRAGANKLSIDSVRTQHVQEVLAGARIPLAEIRVFDPASEVSVDEMVDVHLGFELRGYTALTSVPEVARRVSDRMRTQLLAPSADSVRTAVRELLSQLSDHVHQAWQASLGLLHSGLTKLSESDLHKIERIFGAIAVPFEQDTLLIVSTRRGISQATSDFTVSPFAGESFWGAGMWCGLGLGLGVPESLTLARRALHRAEAHVESAAVVSLRHGSDILLRSHDDPAEGVVEIPSAGVVAAHSGLSVENVKRLQHLARTHPNKLFTTRDIAAELNVEMRTARRLIQRLEHAGYAIRVGHSALAGRGRPPTAYEIAL